MQYRPLGRTGLFISALSLGTATFGNETTKSEAERIISLCLDHGVNLIDTADSTSNAEDMLGRILPEHRHSVLIATKVFNPTGSGPNNLGLSRKHILHACESSLRRLRTDYIDLYQAHSDDFFTPLEETLSAFDQLMRQGKIRYIGASNYCAWRLNDALWTSQMSHLPRYQTLQALYNLIERGIDTEVLPLCRAKNVAVIAWSPLAGGWLSGKYLAPAISDRRYGSGEKLFMGNGVNRGAILSTVVEIARSLNLTPAQVSLRWVMQQDGITSAIFGARNVVQLMETLSTIELTLPDDMRDRLNNVSRPAEGYPYSIEPITRALRQRHTAN